MDQLFRQNAIHLGRWYPSFQDVASENIAVENRRSADVNVKIAHLRPSWVKRQRFRPMPFLRAIMRSYRERYADHAKLEVPIVLGEQERSSLQEFLKAPTSIGA
jgi:hypothetical protein